MSTDSQVGKLDIVLNADASRVSAAVDKVNQKLDQLTAKARTTSQSMQASNSGLIDSVEGVAEGVRRNIAAIDGLGSKTDEVLGKQHTAWLAIGAVVGGTTQSMIQKIAALVDKTAEIPAALETAMRGMNQDAWTKTDALRLANDELENQIAILEKTPQDNLGITLDRDRVRADALAASIQTINDRTTQALAAGHVAGWKRLLGAGPTAKVEGTINSFNDQIADDAYQRQLDLHDNLPLSAKDEDKQRRDHLAAAHKHYQEMLSQLKDGRYENNAPSRSMLELADSQVLNEQDADKEGDRNDADKDRLKRDQDAQRARAEAAAAEQKASQAQMAMFRQQLSERQQNHKMDQGEELAFWQEKLNATKKGSANYIAIYEKLGALTQAMLEKMDAQIAESARKSAEQIKQWDESALRLNDELNKADRRNAENTAAYNEALDKNVSAMAELVAGHDVATGAMTKHDAAVQAATLHAADYAAALKKLKDDELADYNDSSLLPDERTANQKARETQRVGIEGQRDRTFLSDSWTISQQTAVGGFTSAIQEFVAASRDAAAQMKTLVTSTLEGVNRTVIEELTTRDRGAPRHLWEHLGHDTATSVAGTALRSGEASLFGLINGKSGGVLSALGFGGKKADGSSAASALWVRSVSLGLGGTGSLGSLFKGGASSDNGGGVLDTLGPLAANIPFFADGGDFGANSMAVVGERGPELVRFGRSGSVTSNSDLGNFGGDVHHHWNIDARGSSDPAQVRAAVQRGIAEAAPHLMAGSVRAMHEYQKRGPSSKR